MPRRSLFDCLFIFWCFFVPLKTFHSFGDITIIGERLQILTHARHSWPMSSEDSLTCHTYCDTDQPFLMKNVHICLFLCLGFCVSLKNFSLIWRCQHCRWRAVNFNLCSAIMAIEQWRFFSEGEACHTYCETGHSFVIATPRTLDSQTYCRTFSSLIVYTNFMT